MANLKNAGFRKVVPTLKPSDLKGADRTVVTIRSAEPIENPNPRQGRDRKKLLEIKMKEWPDRVYYPNPSGISELIAAFGDETDTWRDQKVPLIVEPATNPETREEIEVLHVAPASKWKEILTEFEGGKKK